MKSPLSLKTRFSIYIMAMTLAVHYCLAFVCTRTCIAFLPIARVAEVPHKTTSRGLLPYCPSALPSTQCMSLSWHSVLQSNSRTCPSRRSSIRTLKAQKRRRREMYASVFVAVAGLVILPDLWQVPVIQDLEVQN
jgi:hypothetical protein